MIVMIALGSLFFWRQRDRENPFGLHFFIFGVLWSFRIPPLRQRSHGQDWADKWARIERDNIRETQDNANYSEFLQGVFELIGVFAGNLSKISD